MTTRFRSKDASAKAAAAGFEPVVAAARGADSFAWLAGMLALRVREQAELIEKLERELALAESAIDGFRRQ